MRFMLVGIVTVPVLALGVLVFADGTAELVGYEVLLLGLVALALRDRSYAERAPATGFLYRRAHADRLPPRLVEIESLSRFSQTSHVDFDRRLLPRLRVVADDRLLSTHGITMADSPERAAEILGGAAWTILNPGRQLIGDVAVPGPTTSRIEAVVSAIERIEDPARLIQRGPHS